MRLLHVAAAAALAALGLAPARAIESETEIVRCSDVAGIAELAGKVGLRSEVRQVEGGSAVLVVSKRNTPFAVAPIVVPELGGCVGILLVAPFGPDNASRADFYNKFNGSEMGAFGAVATTFDGQIAFGHSQMTKYGMIAGNMAFEIQLFAERADAFSEALTSGRVASLPGAARRKALTDAKRFGDPATERTARAVLEAIFPVPRLQR